MNIIEKLSMLIFKKLELDYIYTDTDIKKSVYQLIYIGLTNLYGGDHLNQNDITVDSFLSSDGRNMFILKILGKETYFYVYENIIQGINSAGEVVFNIEEKGNSTYELYIKNTFNTEFRYTVHNIEERKAAKYSFSEVQGSKVLSNGAFIPLDARAKSEDALFKMIVYDLNTNEPIKEDNSILKRIYDSIKGDTSTNTVVLIPLKNQDGQIFNMIDIFGILSVRLNRFYNAIYNEKSKVKKLK